MSNNTEYNEALDKLICQYQNSPKFLKLLETYCSFFEALKECLDDMVNKRSIDTAEGVQLDIIGDIIGQPRLLMSPDNLYYFGFQNSLNTLGFASSKNPSSGGLFYTTDSEKRERILIGDEFYRLLIRAKIQKNICSGTPDEIIKAIMFIFNCSDVILKERTLAIEIGIGKKLTHNEAEIIKQHIDIIPRPLEVKLSVIFKYTEPVFGFNGCPKSKGFASSSNPGIGGNFATIIVDNT